MADEEGMTPVDYAIDGGYSAIAKLVCDRNDRNATTRVRLRDPISCSDR